MEAFQKLHEYFNFVQLVRYSTHIHGSILDLVFNQERTEAVQWMPTPYSDNFMIIIDILSKRLVTYSEMCFSVDLNQQLLIMLVKKKRKEIR